MEKNAQVYVLAALPLPLPPRAPINTGKGLLEKTDFLAPLLELNPGTAKT